jgi:hypothetical protein
LAVLELLGEEHAKLKDMPDEEFTDAYMAFRSRVEETIRQFFNANDPRASGVWAMVKSLIADGCVWLSSFLLGEGIAPEARDRSVFCLDPAPFQEMIEYIRKHSRHTEYSDTFRQTQSIKDYEKMKQLAVKVGVDKAVFLFNIIQREFHHRLP